jgi:hypothetical protein
MPLVLIEAVPTADNPENNPLCVHAIINDTGMIEGRYALFGVYGDWERREEDFAPFVLGADGKVDFGSGYDGDNQRYYLTNLRTISIQYGAPFQLEKEDDRRDVKYYRISRIFTLSA